MKLVLAVTTYNRIEFLKRTLESWNKTRRRDADWTLVITDDGSKDGTLEYLDSLSFDGVDVQVIKNNRVGVHRQTNQLFKAAKDAEFDFGFKIDDDLEFLKEGWDKAYQEAAISTGYHHLVLFDRAWHNTHRGGRVAKNIADRGLCGQIHVIDAMGAFWTFTPDCLNKVGYFDEKDFGVCGWGHVDWSWRACRAGFNKEDCCFDLDGSEQYIRLVQENYRPAMPRGERVASGNTPEQEQIKLKKMKDGSRLFIPYPANERPRVGIVSKMRAAPMKAVVGSVKAVELVEPDESFSNMEIIVTDEPAAIAKASRTGVAVVGMAVGDIPHIVNHEVDGFIYMSDDWLRHWLNALVNDDTRSKLCGRRKERQQTIDRAVTVIIPCYNHADKLERSIGSVAAQTVKAGVIVVDDGSPDDVPGAVEKLREKYPDLKIELVQQDNKGLAAARNTGFSKAKTGWVIPLDADDRIEPKFIEKTLEMQEGTSADVVYTDVTTDNYGFVNMQFQPNHLTVRNTVVCTCLTRKDLWEKVGGYDESMRLGFEDWEFWIRCVQAGGRFVKADGGSLFYYHDADQSMLNESFKKQEQIISYMRSRHWKFFGVPRVSVVIPCYKQAHFLDRCIESITRQTEKDVQIVVVDDGSPDDVAGAVAEARRKYGVPINLVRQENKGLSEARNAGIKKAKAEWILPLDADNSLLEPEWLKNCLDAGEDAGIGVVYTNLKMRSGKLFNSSIHDHERLKKENTLDACALVRKQVLYKLGGYRPRDILEGHEDWDFWLSCIENDIRFKKVNDVHVLYDDVQQERMTPWLQQADTYWRLLAKLKELHPKFFTGKAKPKHPRCSLTVVLSSYNQLETMKLVIESYRQQTAWPIEVIVNDDGSTDGTLEWLDSLTDVPFELRYVTREHSWYRLASGNNSAAKHAKGSRILFTNGDQIHSPKSFESHCKLIASRVGGGVFKGIAQGHAQRVTKDMVTEWNKVKVLQEKYPSAKNNIPHILQTDPNINPIGVWGGNFSVPTAIFARIGGYDEGYDVGWGGEENDLVRRCVKAGCRVEWVKESEIFHLDHPIRAYAYSMLGSRKYMKEFK